MEVTVRLPPRPASTLAHVFRVWMHARMASDAGTSETSTREGADREALAVWDDAAAEAELLASHEDPGLSDDARRSLRRAVFLASVGKYVTLHGVFRPGGISPQTARDA